MFLILVTGSAIFFLQKQNNKRNKGEISPKKWDLIVAVGRVYFLRLEWRCENTGAPKHKQPFDKEDHDMLNLCCQNTPANCGSSVFSQHPPVWHNNNIKAVKLVRRQYCHHMKYACIFFFLFVLQFSLFWNDGCPFFSLESDQLFSQEKNKNRIRKFLLCYSSPQSL